MSENILTELAALNGGSSDIRSFDNVWYGDKPEYSGFISKLKETVKNEDIMGTVLIASDDDIIWASGTRSKDIHGGVVSPLTTFETGSVTKTFTAACIFRLAEEGRLSLDDKVVRYFPEYTKAGDMTIFDLLHMRSGIPDFAEDFADFFDIENKGEDFERAFWNDEVKDEVFLEHLYKAELKFSPSSETAYSNTNYVLLAMIIEKLTGRTYKEFMEEEIFSPLGMASSSAETVGDVTSVPEQEEGYHKAQHTARGAGDIHSNVLDMLRFDRAFFAEKIVSRASMDTMMKLENGYGCGFMAEGFCWWNEEGRPFDEDMIFHGGETFSYTCDNIIFNVSGKRIYLIMMSPCFNDSTKKIIELCREYRDKI